MLVGRDLPFKAPSLPDSFLMAESPVVNLRSHTLRSQSRNTGPYVPCLIVREPPRLVEAILAVTLCEFSG